MRDILHRTFAANLAAGAVATAASERSGHEAGAAVDDDPETYWIAGEGADSAALEFEFPAERRFDVVMLQEQIGIGQRVERFRLEARSRERWTRIADGTTIGFKWLLRLPEVSARRVRLVIEASRSNPTLCNFGFYKSSQDTAR